MKHYSAAVLDRAAAAAALATEAEMLERLRDRLTRAGDRKALAREFGVTPFALAGMLRGRWPVSEPIAEKLGYRRVTRFERVS